jgi:hypothetical protein
MWGTSRKGRRLKEAEFIPLSGFVASSSKDRYPRPEPAIVTVKMQDISDPTHV